MTRSTPNRSTGARRLRLATVRGLAILLGGAGAIHAQQQFAPGELKSYLPRSAAQSNCLAAGDVDGDGHIDLVVGSYEAQNRLFLGDGNGVFTDVTTSRLPVDADRSYAVLLIDVDSDGDLDLVTANSSAQNRLQLNDGSGVFRDVTATHMPIDAESTLAMAAGDVDADGAPDLVLGNSTSGGSATGRYLNDGSGVFTDATASISPAIQDSTRAIRLCDVDGDSDLDLMTANLDRNRLDVNDGTGTFTNRTMQQMPPQPTGFPNESGAISMAIADVDGDGDLDAAYGTYGFENALWLNDGLGDVQRELTESTSTGASADE